MAHPGKVDLARNHFYFTDILISKEGAKLIDLVTKDCNLETHTDTMTSYVYESPERVKYLLKSVTIRTEEGVKEQTWMDAKEEKKEPAAKEEKKKAKKTQVDRLKQEFERQQKLSSHPNIVQAIDMKIVQTQKKKPTEGKMGVETITIVELLFEWGNETLQDLMDIGAIPKEKAIEIAIHTVRGMSYAHEKGIKHPNLIPENILYINGKWKLAGFGLPNKYYKTLSLTRKGTETSRLGVQSLALYAPPEALNPIKEKDDIKENMKEVNVFCWGMILLQILANMPVDDMQKIFDERKNVKPAEAGKAVSAYKAIMAPKLKTISTAGYPPEFEQCLAKSVSFLIGQRTSFESFLSKLEKSSPKS